MMFGRNEIRIAILKRRTFFLKKAKRRSDLAKGVEEGRKKAGKEGKTKYGNCREGKKGQKKEGKK